MQQNVLNMQKMIKYPAEAMKPMPRSERMEDSGRRVMEMKIAKFSDADDNKVYLMTFERWRAWTQLCGL